MSNELPNEHGVYYCSTHAYADTNLGCVDCANQGTYLGFHERLTGGHRCFHCLCGGVFVVLGTSNHDGFVDWAKKHAQHLPKKPNEDIVASPNTELARLDPHNTEKGKTTIVGKIPPGKVNHYHNIKSLELRTVKPLEGFVPGDYVKGTGALTSLGKGIVKSTSLTIKWDDGTFAGPYGSEQFELVESRSEAPSHPDLERILKCLIQRVGAKAEMTEQDLRRADQFQLRWLYNGHTLRVSAISDT